MNDVKEKGIIGFLETKTRKDDLAITLKVLREFKGNESKEEYLSVMFAAWAKLEQLEEYLDYLVNGVDLRGDTKERAIEVGITL